MSAFAGDDVILGVESRDEVGEETPVIMRLSADAMVTRYICYIISKMLRNVMQGEEELKFSPSTINYDRLEEKEIRTSFLQLSKGGGASASDNITVETLLTVDRYLLQGYFPHTSRDKTHLNDHVYSYPTNSKSSIPPILSRIYKETVSR